MIDSSTSISSASATPERRSMTVGQLVCGAWLLLTTFLGLFSLLPWLGLVAFGAVMFDAGPDSELAGMLVWVVLFPLLPIGSITASWCLFVRGKRWTASLIGFACFLPVIWIAQYA